MTTPPSLVEEIVKEFEDRSNNAKFGVVEDSFFFEEGDGLAYDQERAGVWLTKALQKYGEEQRKGVLLEVDKMCRNSRTGDGCKSTVGWWVDDQLKLLSANSPTEG